MLETIEAKLIASGVALLMLGGIVLGIFIWGHHTGSVSQSNADNKKVSACTLQNAALAQVVKTDAATIDGLKQANAQTAAAAEANETDLKKSVAELSAQLAQSQSQYDQRQKKLQGLVRNDKNSAKWANTPVPADIIDLLRN